MKHFIFAIALIAFSTFSLASGADTAKTYTNIKGKVLTESLTKECDNALNNYISAKDKLKLYLKADDDAMISHYAQVVLRWAIESKVECTEKIPGKWEEELDRNIENLSKILKD